MTFIAERLLASISPARTPVGVAPAPRLELRWRSHVSPWTTRFGGQAPQATHTRVDFVVLVALETPGRVVVESWLDAPERRVTVVARQSMPCVFSHDDTMVHLDVIRGEHRVLSLTLSRDHDRVVYARSDLIAKAGLGGGSYDPPSIEVVAARPEVASA